MKKTIVIIICVSFLFSGVVSPALAVKDKTTDIAALEQMIEDLQNQIAELQVKIAALKQIKEQSKTEIQSQEKKEAKEGVKEVKKEVKKTSLQIKRQLWWGLKNNDVTLLQEILATDSDIYPEGLVTGYFGPLTYKAVKRFQKKAGIEQVGVVGPKTTAKLNELLEAGAGKSGKVPVGFLVSSGILKKLGEATIFKPLEGQKVPFGIKKKIETTTPSNNGVEFDND